MAYLSRMTDLSFLEIVATISGILCVWLQTKEKVLAWPFGILSVSISAFIFLNARLYSDLGLHVIYIFLNIYGWYNWTTRSTDHNLSPILNMSMRHWWLGWLGILIGTLILGYMMGSFTDADLYYFDAFTTTGSLFAQWLLAKKYLQNWLFWIVVDCVAIPLYLYKGLYFFSFLFAVYMIICVRGYISWKQSYRHQEEAESQLLRAS